ncbi:hypothetical protein R1sor_005195 [Riccia sorocarpa]|uniref:MULE transposase domain-containing protein n=1 Tax=Riccia sorocarpa TaxID=122646 RepID=A0ABD3HME6_9MARC
MVVLDACHIKNKKYPTLLFLATVVDGNNKIIVLAFDIAPAEDRDMWSWYDEALEVLEKQYPNGQEVVTYIWAIDARKFGRLSEFEREYGGYVTCNGGDNNALVQSNGGGDHWIV